jgi:tetratricopeptide (TPR) repeat protein
MGLDAEEVRQFVRRLGATLDENGPDGDDVVLRLLGGHPHALREVVPLVEDVERWQLLDTLRGDRDSRRFDLPAALFESIDSSLRHLPPTVVDKLVAVRLLSGVVDVDALLCLSDPQHGLRFAGMDAAAWCDVLDNAVDVGLLQRLGTRKYAKHPALSAHLARLWFEQDPDGHERHAALMTLAARERNPAARFIVETGAIIGYARTDDLAAEAHIGMLPQTMRMTYLWTGAGAVLWPLWTFVDYVAPEFAIRRLVAKMLARWDQTQADLDGQATRPDQDGMIWLTLSELMDTPSLPEFLHAMEQVLENVHRMPASPARERRMVATLHKLAEINRALDRWTDARDNALSMLRLADHADTWSHPEAIYPVPEPLASFVRHGEQQDSQATALGLLSEVHVMLDRHTEAVEYNDREIAVRESMDDSTGLGDALRARGFIEKERGEHAEARRWYTRALSRYADHHNRFKESATYYDLGGLALLEWRLGDAEKWYRRARVIHQQRNDISHLATNDVHLGDLARMRGRLNDAEGWYHAAIDRLDELGEDSRAMAMTVTLAWRGLGAVACDRGDLRNAAVWYCQAREMFTMLGDQNLVDHCDAELTRIARFGA